MVGREFESDSAENVVVALELGTSVFSPVETAATDPSVNTSDEPFSDPTACPFPPVDDSDSPGVTESLFAIDASQDAMLFFEGPWNLFKRNKITEKWQSENSTEGYENIMSTHRFVLGELKDSPLCTVAGMVPGLLWFRNRFWTPPRYGRIFSGR